MNQHIDELARYKYADENNSELILEYLNSDDVNYLIDRQLEPDEFMPYLQIEGFNIRNTVYYNTANQARSADLNEIVSFVNEFKDKMNLDTLGTLLLNYDYETLASFWRGEDEYVEGASLVVDPQDLLSVIHENETLYRYVPKNLVPIEDVPVVNPQNHEDIYVRNETFDALTLMCEAAYELNQKTCGNMIVVEGYVSYDQQVDLYEQAILHYGQDEASLHASIPGKNASQLGSVIKMVPAQVDLENNPDSLTPSQQWLIDNAYRYGFMLEGEKEKRMNEFVLRYIGENNALQVQMENQSIEDLK